MLQGREKIRRTKTKLELNIATVVKNNEKSFYKYIVNKRTVKEILCPLRDAVGSILLCHEETSGVLYAFFPSVLNTRTTCPQATHLPELEFIDGELNEVLIIHEVSDN